MPNERIRIRTDVAITGFKCPACQADVAFDPQGATRLDTEVVCGSCQTTISVRYMNRERH